MCKPTKNLCISYFGQNDQNGQNGQNLVQQDEDGDITIRHTRTFSTMHSNMHFTKNDTTIFIVVNCDNSDDFYNNKLYFAINKHDQPHHNDLYILHGFDEKPKMTIFMDNVEKIDILLKNVGENLGIHYTDKYIWVDNMDIYINNFGGNLNVDGCPNNRDLLISNL